VDNLLKNIEKTAMSESLKHIAWNIGTVKGAFRARKGASTYSEAHQQNINREVKYRFQKKGRHGMNAAPPEKGNSNSNH
jgi:hypothetical protein